MKTDRLNLMISPEEKAAIVSRAKALNLSTSELVRRAVSSFDPDMDSDEMKALAREFLQSVQAAERALDRTIARLETLDARIERVRQEAREAQMASLERWPFEPQHERKKPRR